MLAQNRTAVIKISCLTTLGNNINNMQLRPVTSLHTPLSMSNTHMSFRGSPPDPPTTTSSGCSCSAIGPVIQKAAWESLAHGLGPLVIPSLLQFYAKRVV